MSKRNQMSQGNDSSNRITELVELSDGELQQIVGGGPPKPRVPKKRAFY